MTWWAIDVRPEPSRRDQVGAWLVARTGHAVEEREDGTLVTFAEDEHAAEGLIAALESAEDGPLETARSPWCRPGSSRRRRFISPWSCWIPRPRSAAASMGPPERPSRCSNATCDPATGCSTWEAGAGFWRSPR